MTGKGWSILNPHSIAIGCLARQMPQEREPCGSFYQCADRRTVEAENEIALPVTGHRSISDFRGALANHDRGINERFALAANAHARHA